METKRNTSTGAEYHGATLSIPRTDSFTQATIAHMNSLHVNLSLSDDVDGSLCESYASSSTSSFSYAEPATPCSESSRRPSVTSEDWPWPYSLALSSDSQRQTPPCTPWVEPAISPVNNIAINPHMRSMSSSIGAPCLDDYLSENRLTNQSGGIIPVECSMQTPDLQHWWHSNGIPSHGLPGTPWNPHESLAIPGLYTVNSEAVDIVEGLANSSFDNGATSDGYQLSYGERLRAEALAPLTVVPSQTFTMPFIPKPAIADPFQSPGKTESVGSPAQNHSFDGSIKSELETTSMYCSPPLPCRNRRAPKKAKKKETYRIGFLDYTVAPYQRYKCTWTDKDGEKCGRSFVRQEHLKRHTEIHLPKTLVICPVCKHDFGGGRKDNLLTHIVNTHLTKASVAERRDRITDEEARRLDLWPDICRKLEKMKEKEERKKKEKEERQRDKTGKGC